MKLLIKGNRAVIKGLQTFEKLVESKVKDALHEWGTETETLSKARVPVASGELQRSINKGKEGDWIWTVGTNVNYAPFVEFGTGALVDIPQGLEDYAIQFKGAGIKEVNLPARPYLFNSGREKFRELIEKLKKDFGK